MYKSVILKNLTIAVKLLFLLNAINNFEVTRLFIYNEHTNKKKRKTYVRNWKMPREDKNCNIT